ncbi:MAG: transcriptional regulator [Bacteroidetes bacterium RIFCSPLOWO2_02_FULL_36_8]|nr:MAG: transcriptional regulator [Bacteroidetes bacterium RIFCSPLOWO2_02_FULL_36_8]OFY70092.1 MAG: transcriptional regulator [Bacteroidetes bacterium RIFCSPLOWO2_12_FULL_37_12]
MPEISRFFGIIVRMYFNDHSPPHFHAEYQEYEAKYDIKTLKIIKGKMSKRANALILEWADDHRKELIKNWELSAVPKPLKSIEPLK